MVVGDHVTVTTDNVNLRVGPSPAAAIVAVFMTGTTAVVTELDGAWAKVLIDGPAQIKGYFATQFLAATDYLSKVRDINVFPIFPGTPQGNITANLRFVCDGLRACNLDDRPMLLMALGTIRAETASFRPISEGVSQYNTSPGGQPFDLYDPPTQIARTLGNTHTGDGAKFKGRGFVQLTGRANYGRIGTQIGKDLIGNPELGNDPATAGRVLAQFLKNNESAIRTALRNNDLAKARKLVNGGSHGLDAFEDAYNKGKISLPA
ncbi:MAG: peptidoglycan-binding protein [Proteobacteria bacterium]|nr:peptidoglycan-binding protein [Pseudomonadota bacterium]